MKSYLVVALLVALLFVDASVVRGDDKEKGKGNGNSSPAVSSPSKGKSDDSKGKSNDDKSKGKDDDDNDKDDDDKDEEDYDVTPGKDGAECATCKGKKSPCYGKKLQCPKECPGRKPGKNKKNKGCHINCGKKCEVTCKWRKPNCDGYGSLCYDPRFVGGDGAMFYFHGQKGGNFAIVSDEKLQINAHFIGTRPEGRTRDYTWVQALAVMFESHTLVIAANKVAQWDDNVEALSIRWDGETVYIPEDEWSTRAGARKVVVERTDELNSVKVTVYGLVEMKIRVRPIEKEENRVHNYQIPSGDAFAHLETQFTFTNLSNLVEGVLGKTYQPGYVSLVKRGVPMPVMGGEDKYQTPALLSPVCKACRFQRPSEVADASI